MSEKYCTDPSCSGAGRQHFHVELPEHEVNMYKAMHEAGRLQGMGSEIERTRTVQTHNHADLLDHLRSDNGHVMGKYAEFRNTHEDEHIPGVRPKEHYDNELSHRELIALHQHDHNKYTDMDHTSIDGEHFHH
jgi:hypothetical protein